MVTLQKYRKSMVCWKWTCYKLKIWSQFTKKNNLLIVKGVLLLLLKVGFIFFNLFLFIFLNLPFESSVSVKWVVVNDSKPLLNVSKNFPSEMSLKSSITAVAHEKLKRNRNSYIWNASDMHKKSTKTCLYLRNLS